MHLMSHKSGRTGHCWPSVAIVALMAVACAPIQQSANLATPLRQSNTAGIGDTVFRAEGRESMPNVVGRADIFGRTRSTGVTILQYGGLHNGKVVLLRSGIVSQSEATTMNSSPTIVQTETSGRPLAVLGGTRFIQPDPAPVTHFQQPAVPFEVDWRRNPRVPISGQVLVIEAANETSLTYHLE